MRFHIWKLRIELCLYPELWSAVHRSAAIYPAEMLPLYKSSCNVLVSRKDIIGTVRRIRIIVNILIYAKSRDYKYYLAKIFRINMNIAFIWKYNNGSCECAAISSLVDFIPICIHVTMFR